MLAHGLETNALRVLWNRDGRLVSVFDKKAKRELIPEGEEANVVTLYEDRPRAYDAWELEYSHQRKEWNLPAPKRVEIVENSSVLAVVLFRWKFRKSSLTQRLIVYPGKTRIDFVTHVEWNERETVMKVAFPTVIHASRARFDIQFGSLERPTTKNTSWEFAKFETVGHKWADLSESGYGAALLNDSKYGYDVHGGTLRLTLLKSANHPDYTADAGPQDFTYSCSCTKGNGMRQAWTARAGSSTTPRSSLPRGRAAGALPGEPARRDDRRREARRGGGRAHCAAARKGRLPRAREPAGCLPLPHVALL